MSVPAPIAQHFPQLNEWLHKHNGRRLWRQPVSGTTTAIEMWELRGGGTVLLELRGLHGWDLWTNLDSLDIGETVADAEARTGVGGGA